MRVKQCIGACALISMVSVTHAADQGFYFGASGGQAKYDFALPALPPGVIGFLPPVAGFVQDTIVFRPSPVDPIFIAPAPIIGAAAFVAARPVLWLPGEDDEGTSWSVGGGYRFNRYLALGASYVNLGTLNATHTVGVPAVLGGGPLGAGAQFDWRDHWSARLEFQRSFDLGGDDVASEADVDAVSLAILYRL